MKLPQSQKFEQLLASFAPTEPSAGEEWRKFVGIAEQFVNDDGNLKKNPEVVIWYKQESDLKIEGVLRKLQDCLRAHDHLDDVALAATILTIFAHVGRNDASAVDHFNRMFGQIITADLSQYSLLREVDLPTFRFRVGPFSVGPFDPNGLEYRCNKSGSDFFARYERLLRSMAFAVERDFRPVKVVFWHKLLNLWAISGPQASWPVHGDYSRQCVVQAIDYYFAKLSELYFKGFFKELRERQEIPMALGSGWFDLSQLQEFLGSQQVSIYLNIGGQKVGFVSPSSMSFASINVGGAHIGVPKTEKFLKDVFGFADASACEIHQTIKAFAHFLAIAREHEDSGRYAEGFLHYVIALDLLLGERKALSASVAARCATLTHRAIGESFDKTEAVLDEIYDARSKYVHKGIVPPTALIPVVQRSARELAFCLFRLQKREANRTSGFVARWLTEVDFIYAALKAGRPIGDDDWSNIGTSGPCQETYSELQRRLDEPATPK